jgi:hypothetical protein
VLLDSLFPASELSLGVHLAGTIFERQFHLITLVGGLLLARTEAKLSFVGVADGHFELRRCVSGVSLGGVCLCTQEVVFGVIHGILLLVQFARLLVRCYGSSNLGIEVYTLSAVLISLSRLYNTVHRSRRLMLNSCIRFHARIPCSIYNLRRIHAGRWTLLHFFVGLGFGLVRTLRGRTFLQFGHHLV